MNRDYNSSSVWRRWVWHYGLAFVSVAAGFGLRMALTAWVGPGLPTYITFYPAVMVAALLAGFGPGLLATALTGLSVAYWILPPEGFSIASPVDRVGLVLFAGMGLFMSAIAEFYRRDRRKAAAYDREIALRESRENLRQSEARLASIVGSAMDAIISVNADQRIVLFNAAAEKMFCCTAAEALGQPLDRFIPARYRDRHREHMRSFGATGMTARTMTALGALTALRADGQEFPIEASLSQVDVKGQKLFTVIMRDITERLAAEAALKKANEELEGRVAERTSELQAAFRYARSLLEASLDPLVTISPAGKITDVNQATELATGLRREQLIGTDFACYFMEPQKAETGYQKVLAEGTVRDYPLTIRHVSGRTTDVLYNATVYRDEAGTVQGVFAAARDITERQKAERQLDFTNSLLALFVQKASLREYLDSAVDVIRRWSGCQALGIRIVDENREIPYEAAAGFEPGFLELENRLSLDRDNCCCIRAVSAAFEDQDRALLTPAGSFHCDDNIAFVDQLPPGKRARYRGNCMKFGFASLAVIPLRYRDQIIGAIHLADRRPGCFPPAVVGFIESMSPLIGEAVHRFQTEAMLSETNRALQAEIAQRERTEEAHRQVLRRLSDAEETERGRISRELHDRLGQDLTGLKLGLQLVRKLDPLAPSVQESVSKLEQLADGLMRDIHRLAWELHPAVLDDLGLETVLRRYTAEWSENNRVPVDFHSSGVEAQRLPLELETTLYRITQEALTNVTRHANAKRVSVLLERRPDYISLIVEDDGGGFDPKIQATAAQGKLGLLGMRERVTLAGGTLEIESGLGAGTTVFVRVPLKPKSA